MAWRGRFGYVARGDCDWDARGLRCERVRQTMTKSFARAFW